MMQDCAPQVLIIDDLDQSRHLLRTMLETQGFHVEVTSDGHAGLRCLRTSRQPVVATISNVLTDFTASELLQRVAEEPELARRHAYVLMTLSPEAARRKLQQTRQQLSILLLENPHDLERLCGAVHEAAARLQRTQSALTVH
jgi:DNA-binding NtrC family response regulator